MSTDIGKNAETDPFPVPRPIQSIDLPTPKPLPGVTPASTATLREVLSDNHKCFHCFFNEKGFNNHLAHTTIALWHLGADPDVIKAAYAFHSSHQRPAFSSPGPINKDNWPQHLGDEKYYNAYLAFFVSELAAKGPAAALEEYVFSDAANFPGGEHQVEMLTRFNGGLLHPLIHTGYGFELGLPGIVAEGLSQTSVSPAIGSELIPAHSFKETREVKPNATKSVLDILARVIADPEIGLETQPDQDRMYEAAVEKFAGKISKHVGAWTPELSSKEALRETLEEVVVFAVILYAVPGLTSRDKGDFTADFFTMHFVTSSMFLSSLLLHLKPRSQERLLRGYVSTCFAWLTTRGKPQLDIEAFFAKTDSLKSLIDASTVSRPSLPDVPAASTRSSNPWTSILEATIVHPDDHISKIQRTLAHYAQVYGNVVAGHFGSTELKGAEKIDGTLFVRAANLTAARLNDATKEKTPVTGGGVSWWDSGFWPTA
ncbi:Oxidoreductase AflY [Leucoagaricus sp. SymC.cos]|nr:Oxidoreductase AflY [Leucoagaricus sp. SymC.cos]